MPKWIIYRGEDALVTRQDDYCEVCNQKTECVCIQSRAFGAEVTVLCISHFMALVQAVIKKEVFKR